MLTLSFPFSSPQSGFQWAEVSFSGSSDWVAVPSGVSMVSVAAHPAAGQTVRVEYTLSSPLEINAGTARWMAWPKGDILLPAADALLTMCVGLRGVSSGGTAIIEVLAR